MPCRSDYPDPTQQESYRQRTAKLYAFALKWSNKKVPPAVRETAKECYAKKDYTRDLCELINGLDSVEQHDLMFDAAGDEDAMGMRLWWTLHQEGEERRRREDAEKQRWHTLYESAKKKLNNEELIAIGKKFKGEI